MDPNEGEIPERKKPRLLQTGGKTADWPLCRWLPRKALPSHCLLPTPVMQYHPTRMFCSPRPCFNGYIPLARPADVSPDPLFLPRRKSRSDFPITAFSLLAFLLPEMEAPCLACSVNICIIQRWLYDKHVVSFRFWLVCFLMLLFSADGLSYSCALYHPACGGWVILQILTWCLNNPKLGQNNNKKFQSKKKKKWSFFLAKPSLWYQPWTDLFQHEEA